MCTLVSQENRIVRVRELKRDGSQEKESHEMISYGFPDLQLEPLADAS